MPLPMIDAPLRSVVVRFADDDSGLTFPGYTDGRLWNGFDCPHLALREFRRALEMLVAWGDEAGFTVSENEREVYVRGTDGIDYTMRAKLVSTTDGDRWLFDCGGAWTFVKIVKET